MRNGMGMEMEMGLGCEWEANGMKVEIGMVIGMEMGMIIGMDGISWDVKFFRS